MSVAVVQRGTAANATHATSLAFTFGSNVTSSNAIIVFALSAASTSSFGTPTDTLNNTYTRVASIDGTNGMGGAIFVATQISAGANTVTLTTGGQNSSLHVYEASGLGTSTPYDAMSSTFSTTSNTLSTDSATGHGNNSELYFSIGRNNGSSTTTYTNSNNFTNLITDGVIGVQGLTAEHPAFPGSTNTVIQVSAGTMNGTLEGIVVSFADKNINNTPSPNISNTVTTSESIKVNIVPLISSSDSTTLSESVTVQPTAPADELVNTSNSVTTNESMLITGPYFANDRLVSVNEAVVATETQNVTDVYTISLASESVVTDDQASAAFVFLLPTSDSSTVSETLTVSPESYVTYSETVATSEAITNQYDVTFAISENISVSEQMQEAFYVEILPSEAVTITESIALKLSYVIDVSDSINATEHLNPNVVDFVTTSDSAVTSESKVVTKENNLVFSDSVTVSETIAKQLTFTIIAGSDELYAAFDTLRINITSLVNDSDSVTTSTQATVQLSYLIGVNDSSTLNDTASAAVPLATVSIHDSSAVAESSKAYFESNVTTSDSVAASENKSVAIPVTPVASDSISTADSANVQVNTSVTVADTITSYDSAAQFDGLFKLVFTENVAIVAANNQQIRVTITQQDASTTIESYHTDSTYLVTGSDVVATADTYAAQALIHGITQSDSSAIVDAPSVTIPVSVAKSETSSVIDTPTLVIPILFIQTYDSSSVVDVQRTLFTPISIQSEQVRATEALNVVPVVAIVRSESATTSETLLPQVANDLMFSEAVVATLSLTIAPQLKLVFNENVAVSAVHTVSPVSFVVFSDNVSTSEVYKQINVYTIHAQESVHLTYSNVLSVVDDTYRVVLQPRSIQVEIAPATMKVTLQGED